MWSRWSPSLIESTRKLHWGSPCTVSNQRAQGAAAAPSSSRSAGALRGCRQGGFDVYVCAAEESGGNGLIEGVQTFCAWGDGAVAVHRRCGCPVLDKVADVPFFAATVLGVTEQETVEFRSCSFYGFVQFLDKVLYVPLQCYDTCLGDRAENSGSSAVAAFVGAVQFLDKVVEWVLSSSWTMMLACRFCATSWS